MRVLLVLLLAGCSHTAIEARSEHASNAIGGGQVGVHIESRSLAAVVIAGMFIAAAAEEARDPRPFPSFSVFSDWFRGTPKGELDPRRRVHEQDCSKPVDLSGNLKCR